MKSLAKEFFEQHEVWKFEDLHQLPIGFDGELNMLLIDTLYPKLRVKRYSETEYQLGLQKVEYRGKWKGRPVWAHHSLHEEYDE